MVTRSPDRRLVYLHCSSIFSGANAHVRKPKKILQLLTEHKKSIKIPTNEFSLDAIAVVAKQLLDWNVFGSIAPARLQFPELFRASKTQEAEREASEADAARVEAEAMEEIQYISEDEGEEETSEADHIQDRQLMVHVQPEIQAGERASKKSESREAADHIPRLHPVYLPFKTQHRILTFVQLLLEECCFQFGNTWVPDLMKAQSWEEPESIELTQWVRKFSKYAKRPLPEATKAMTGKSLVEVLFATSNIRHSAVYRLLNSAVGIINMVSAAIAFAEALTDEKRAALLEKIREQLTTRVEEIIQHQTLLENKLSEQLQDFSRRRAEIDELQRLAVEDMLDCDKVYRKAHSLAMEASLSSLQGAQYLCAVGGKFEALAKDDVHVESLCPAGTIACPFPADCEKEASIDVASSAAAEGTLAPKVAPKLATVIGDLLSTTQSHSTPAEAAEIHDGFSPCLQIVDGSAEMTSDISGMISSVSPSQFITAPVEEPKDGPTMTAKYPVALKIVVGVDFFTCMASLESNTRTEILKQACAAYSKGIQKHKITEPQWKTICTPSLLSVRIDGLEIDLSTYNSDNLTFLIQIISKSSIPTFTVDISQTQYLIGN